MSDRTNRYRFGVEIDPAPWCASRSSTPAWPVELVFRSPQVCQLEHKGGFMLERLFGALRDNYLDRGGPGWPLLSRDFEQEMAAAGH